MSEEKINDANTIDSLVDHHQKKFLKEIKK